MIKVMPKYRFKFEKVTVHFIIPHQPEETKFQISLMGLSELKKLGYYTDEQLYKIGNIPMGTLMNMFKEIR
jgi:hypothetical protein